MKNVFNFQNINNNRSNLSFDKINYQYHKPSQKRYRARKRNYNQILSDAPKNINNKEMSLESSLSNNSKNHF